MTLANKLPAADLFFHQIFICIEFQFHFDLLKASSAPQQPLADKVHFAVPIVFHGEIVAQIDVAFNLLTTAIAFDEEGI